MGQQEQIKKHPPLLHLFYPIKWEYGIHIMDDVTGYLGDHDLGCDLFQIPQ